MDNDIKDMIENAKEIERLKVNVEKLEIDMNRNFEQHREFFALKKYISILETVPAKIELLEESRDKMKGAIKIGSWVIGLLLTVIGLIVSL